MDYRASKFREEVLGTWAVSLVFRPIGLLLAWAMIRIGVSARSLTLAGLASTLLLLAFAFAAPAEWLLLAIPIQTAFYQTMDHCDGQVARSTGTASARGAFLDGMSDILWRAVILGTIGHCFDALTTSGHTNFLAIGIAAAFAATFARLVRESGPKSSDAPTFNAGSIAFAFLSGLDQIAPFFGLWAWHAGFAGAFMWIVLGYHTCDLLGVILAEWRRLKPS